ncbi:MarR family winged helix-turn-helix transcriptional regulator [Actinomadura verrucosospora]|uniref:MarR family transcriptional regulator n=1 Tax=Actinomadura verrucosospora TaxID=46165 RepID=A0A7D4APN7_ACTVE|nr:MarR family transcriptional regulator [Actinomadura verrucosospora]QKG21929.1 MarR family transcriptional regulator [Actinomadura verrucosospora]
MNAYERGTGFLLARLGSLTARSWTAFLAAHDLSQGQYAVLVTLDEHGPQGQRRLAGLVAVDARNIVAVLDSLAKRGLVERRPDETDRRRRTIALTEQGHALVKAVADAAAEEQDGFLRALDPAERAQLNVLLKRIYASHVGGTA